jgi:hypothetical protein
MTGRLCAISTEDGKLANVRFAPRAAELVQPNRKCNSRQQAPIPEYGISWRTKSRRLVAGSDWDLDLGIVL